MRNRRNTGLNWYEKEYTYPEKCERCRWRSRGSCNIHDIAFANSVPTTYETEKSENIAKGRNKRRDKVAANCVMFKPFTEFPITNKQYFVYRYFNQSIEDAEQYLADTSNDEFVETFKRYCSNSEEWANGSRSLMGIMMWELLGMEIDFTSDKHPTYEWLKGWLDKPCAKAFNGEGTALGVKYEF